jgi:uncharacterized protein
VSVLNPFRYSEPVPPAELIDRDGEAELLLRRALEGNNSRVVAPRRYGKTSLLRRVAEAAEKEGWAAVYVDFFGVLTLTDVAERVERAYDEALRGGLRGWFTSVRRTLRPTFRAGGGPVPAGVEVTVDPQAESPLLDRLALPARLFERRGVRTLVVFDEFQDVLAARDRADAVIRSAIQHHGDAASYVFAGSHVGMMRELFGDRRRAFYGQAGAVELPPLRPDDLGEEIDRRFRATGRDAGEALGPLLDAADGHPQRAMLLAHAVWDRTAARGAATEETWADAYDAVLREAGGELRGVWTSLTTGQRRVLAAIGENSAPLYSASQGHGSSRGAAIGKAVRVLLDRGEIVEDGAAVTGHRVVDPLLVAWLREGRLG